MSDPKLAPPTFTQIQNQIAEIHARLFPDDKPVTPDDAAFIRAVNGGKYRNVLKELCETKIIKDVQGDTPEYRQRRDAAWEAAFALFPEYAKQSCAHGPGLTCNNCRGDKPVQTHEDNAK